MTRCARWIRELTLRDRLRHVPLARRAAAQALKWINGYLGNYGWSIIALTVLINLLIFPLRHRSMVSMRKMQALQPEVKAIQDRYAKYKITDPERQKMNQEMMALYKQKGVNPASGCVPMLLTMPVLFAFYAMLSAVDRAARRAVLRLDCTTSRVHDPLYITPVLMGATMFWQQRMMPTTADPMQQKMFMLMPVIFTVIVPLGPERASSSTGSSATCSRSASRHHEPDDRRAGPAGAGRRRRAAASRPAARSRRRRQP